MNRPEDYLGKTNGRQGRPFTPGEEFGHTSLEVLPILKGKPWDEVALAYVSTLRPSHVRVVTDTTQCDSQAWRVTVWLDEESKIDQVTQEVQVDLPERIPNGGALYDALVYGIESPQLDWHRIDAGTLMCEEGIFKMPEGQEPVPYPFPTNP